MSAKSPIDKNRRYWNASSRDYQHTHGATLEREPLAWGTWRIPESEVDALGELSGRDVLELGCGAAQWSIALRALGARALGVDLSIEQLRHAALRVRELGTLMPIANGDAERLPFADACFDVVFCDHGAMSFARPSRTVPEAARVLRSGGRFAFCMSTPLRDLCWDEASERVSTTLARDYFALDALEALDAPDAEDATCFQLPYGEWIRLFGRCSLVVEDLVELRPREDAVTTYTDYIDLDWARRWPAEHVWKLRKVER